MDPRDVIAANLRDLMARWPLPEDQRFKRLRNESSIANGTLERILKAAVDTGVDKLVPLARAFGLEPWELLVPPDKREAVHHLVRAIDAVSPPQEKPVNVPSQRGKRTGTTG